MIEDYERRCQGLYGVVMLYKVNGGERDRRGSRANQM